MGVPKKPRCASFGSLSLAAQGIQAGHKLAAVAKRALPRSALANAAPASAAEPSEEHPKEKRARLGPAPGTKYSKARTAEPALWEAEKAADTALDGRLSRLAAKVEAEGGRVINSDLLWCTVCRKQVPLHQACSVQRWQKHISPGSSHQGARALSDGLAAVVAAASPVVGSHEWLEQRKAVWRALVCQKRANRAAAP